jgi:chromosome segregation ATPase
METPVEWLEGQLEKAKHDLDEARRRLEEAQRDIHFNEKRLEACAQMLEIARADDRAYAEKSIVRPQEVVESKPGMNMPDHIEELLIKHGRLSTSELCVFLREQGRVNTSVNSVKGQLHRHKSRRFNRNEEGKWYLAGMSR